MGQRLPALLQVGRSFLVAVFFCFVTSTANANATPREVALAQAVKKEAEALRKDMQDMIDSKQFDVAIGMLNKRGSAWLSKYGAKSWPMAEVSSMLADVYFACGARCDKEDAATELYEKSASVKLAIYGQEHPEYAAAIQKAAEALTNTGAHRRALHYFKKLAKGVAAGLGEEHEALRRVRMKLADCAMRSKSYKTAKRTFAQLLQSKLPTEDEAHARLQMAVAMVHLAENDAALQHAEAAKHLVAEQFGRKDIQYAKALNGVAGVLERLNRAEDALRNMQEASDIVANVLGQQDPMAIQARKNVEGLRMAMKSKSPEMSAIVKGRVSSNAK